MGDCAARWLGPEVKTRIKKWRNGRGKRYETRHHARPNPEWLALDQLPSEFGKFTDVRFCGVFHVEPY
jgi:hypothetical protein